MEHNIVYIIKDSINRKRIISNILTYCGLKVIYITLVAQIAMAMVFLYKTLHPYTLAYQVCIQYINTYYKNLLCQKGASEKDGATKDVRTPV